MLNILTIDLEDWRQLIHWKMTGEQIAPLSNVVSETEWILETLDTSKTQATFFVLANVARTYPELIQQIDRAGHEIACHGLSHQLIYRQSQEQFRQETKEAKDLLESIIEKPILGYRAAEFSITKNSLWALDILAQLGFIYDSSIYPIQGKRYGIDDAPLEPYLIKNSENKTIVECPLTIIERLDRRWPVAGGGYFRLLPYIVTKTAIRQINQQGRSAVAYFHPYEFSQKFLVPPAGLKSLKYLGKTLRYSLLHNLLRTQVRQRFLSLLKDFQFTTMGEVVKNVSTN